MYRITVDPANAIFDDGQIKDEVIRWLKSNVGKRAAHIAAFHRRHKTAWACQAVTKTWNFRDGHGNKIERNITISWGFIFRHNKDAVMFKLVWL